MDIKWNMGQQYALGEKMACSTLGCIKKIISGRLREVILLCSTHAERIPEMVSPGLAFPAQERYGHTGIMSVRGHKDTEGIGACKERLREL